MKVLLALLAMLALAGVHSPVATAEESSPAEQALFVVSMKLSNSGDMAADGEVLKGHIAYLNELYDRGVLYLAGPYADTYHEGQAVLLATSAEEVRALLQDDPSVKAGLMSVEAIHPWWAAFSLPDKRRMTVEQFAGMMAQAPGKEDQAAHSSGGTVTSGSEAAGTASEEGGMGMTIGGVSWIEIPSANPEASQAFYSKVFGWEVSSQDDMHFFTTPGGDIGGVFNPDLKTAAPMSGPQFYVNCQGLKAKLEEVKAAGGAVVTEPMQLPNDWGFIAIVSDPEGNALGVWSATE